jgi:mono/diheme cytochrome c family protein
LSPGLTRAFGLALAAAALGACGGPGATSARECPDDAPLACPSGAPTFSRDAAPIIAAHCAKCHGSGGVEEKLPFATYAEIAPSAGDMMLELETCQMPPPAEPPLSPAERQALFAWITCGARDD